MSDQNLALTNARRNCLDCCCDSKPAVIWCTCHGEDGTRCEFWPFRFGIQPATFQAKYGDRLLTPALMPHNSIELELLPGTVEQAATAEIDLPGYHQLAVVVEKKTARELTPGQAKGLQKAHSSRAADPSSRK